MSETTESQMQLVIQLASILGAGVPMPEGKLKNWDADFYVLCVPKFAISPTTANLTFQYDLEASGVYRVSEMKTAGIPSIVEFARAVYDGTLQEPKSLPLETGAKAMEFAMRGNCYIVIALADLNWQFNRRYYAVTIAGDFVQYYGDLNQLDKDGISHPMPPPADLDPKHLPAIGPWSTIAYFSARMQPDHKPGGEHPFNLHIQIIQGTQMVPITIDPDIKNDGNQPTWPP